MEVISRLFFIFSFVATFDKTFSLGSRKKYEKAFGTRNESVLFQCFCLFFSYKTYQDLTEYLLFEIVAYRNLVSIWSNNYHYSLQLVKAFLCR